MRAVEFIWQKRQGKRHTQLELESFIQDYVKGNLPDYQMSAWLMAVFFQGLDFEETSWLTSAMIHSGEILQFPGNSLLVDKHSTGGVGDKVSLMLAPMVAACGLKVPMMSGRSLGHTGGTLDKLEAIPGYRTSLTPGEMLAGLEQNGYFMTGQTERVVPADRLMYALRDVTATVESIPLITASILSKKFAEGASSLVFDVKVGSGAFMKTLPQARALGQSLVQTAQALGRRAVAVLTSMNVPLGRMVGNFLEVEEAYEFLNNRYEPDLGQVTFRLAAWMLRLGGVTETLEQGETLAKAKLEDGSALELFQKNVLTQGGNWREFEQQIGQRRAPIMKTFTAPHEGVFTEVDAQACGLIATGLGAGRNQKTDRIYPEAGLEWVIKPGKTVNKGTVIAKIWTNSEAKAEEAVFNLEQACRFEPKAQAEDQLILEEIV